METQPRQNFHTEVEAGINKQINMELYASYTYQSMVTMDGISLFVNKLMVNFEFSCSNLLE